VSSGKFVRDVILPLREKDRLSGKKGSGWKRPDLLWEFSLTSSSTETYPFLSGRWTSGNKSLHLFVVCLSKLFSSIFDLLPLRSTWVCYLCVQRSLPCLWSSTKATHQVWIVLEVKRSLKLFMHVLCGPRPTVYPVEGNGLTGATCWAEPGTGLTGQPHRSDRWRLAVQVLGDVKFKSVESPIHPHLGDIKVLSALNIDSLLMLG
jgi:hypothetical protein